MSPVHPLRHTHVQLKPLFALMEPETFEARPLQSAGVHARTQLGRPENPGKQRSQLGPPIVPFPGSRPGAQTSQLGPLQKPLQEQLHPVEVMPVTETACPEQSLADVHFAKHAG